MVRRIREYIHDTRAGATAIAAAAVTVMAVGATALIVDHNWLVDQRDMLKAAADAGAVAATLELNRRIGSDPGIDDHDLEELLDEVAERYVVLNLNSLSEERLTRALSTLVVKATPDKSSGTVEVVVTADLGGTIFSRHMPMLGHYEGPESIQTASIVESTNVPVEVVLAIDVSGSMSFGVDGTTYVPPDESRMGVVKEASLALVDLLDPSAHHRIAVGVVPWHVMVRLDRETQERWLDNAWAVYPRTRYYAMPYQAGRGTSPPEGVTQTLAATAPQAWWGCLNEHRITNGARHADWPPSNDLLATPETVAFAQAFFPSYEIFAYECAADPLPSNLFRQYCYTEITASEGWRQRVKPSQHGCERQGSPLLPLTSNRRRIEEEIDALKPIGSMTYSTLGVLWAQRMLSPQWKRTWGDGVHPLDPTADGNKGLRKVIVLLTDGEDNYCGDDAGACVDSELGVDRNEACALVKNAGTEIFVVAAMPPDEISGDLARSLRRCSSEAERPGGTYVFINNADAHSLRSAFADIARQLLELRKVY